MTNVPPAMLSPRAENIHVNHGWWCTDCTNELFEVESKRDFTDEWLEALAAWARMAGHFCGELLVALATGIVGLFMSFAWIVICLHDGVVSDTREYEKQLKEHDGLERRDRDFLNTYYEKLLADRQRLVKRIDQVKTGIALESASSSCNPENLDILKDNQDALILVERLLRECEHDLRCAQMA